MKKRYVILAALLVTALAAAGCGKKQTEDTGKDGQVTVAQLRIQIQLQVMTVPW